MRVTNAAMQAIQADITTLAVDAIVNAANASLLGVAGLMERFIALPGRTCCVPVANSAVVRRERPS